MPEKKIEDRGWKIRNQYATYFVTFTVVAWVDIFTRYACRKILLDSLLFCIKKKGLTLFAYVIMSNHIHLVVAAKEDSKGLSAIIRDFKSFTSKSILAWIQTSGKERRKEWMLMIFRYHAKYNKRNTTFQFWIQNNHPVELSYPSIVMQKIAYIHNNPVSASIVDHPADYVYSSARNYYGRHDFIFPVTVIDYGVQEGVVY